MTLQLQPWERSLLLRATDVNQDVQPFLGADAELLDKAYESCREITAHHSKSFYVASALLPRHKRQAVRALYAFCRITDDIVDCNSENVEIMLHRWREKVFAGHVTSDDLVTMAWADTRAAYRIPAGYISQLIDGVARDLEQDRYASFDELASYAYGVASTVGLMSMHIVGFANREAIPYAIKLGVALQLTNILRDVGQDWQLGRVYLPQDELLAFGITPDYFDKGVVDDRWRDFMRFQISRTRTLYAEALPGIAMLHPDGRLAIAAAADLYAAILDDIEAHDYDVFNRRAFISTWAKLRRLPRLWWQTRQMQQPLLA